MKEQVIFVKLKIPTGIMNYRELRTNNYYTVDKTLMIQDFLERGSKVTLLTRPRRFGKTLNLSMLAEFFDITKESFEIFKNTKIMQTKYAAEMNQYPTIFISFLNAKGDENNVIKYIKEELLREYERYSFICNRLKERQVRKYQRMINIFDNEKESLRIVYDAFSFLVSCLEDYYQRKVMIFIDEYDTPFIEAHMNGFYNTLHVDLASLLRTVLKGNDSLQYGFLTGIQRVAKENVFSDLNNLKVFTIKDKEYAQYFGFTVDETKELLSYYHLEYTHAVKDMYNGYNIGGLEIFNPWSIINYADEKELKPYWVNTGSNIMIKKAMEHSGNIFREEFEALIQENMLVTQITMETSFYEQSNTSSLWGLFVNAGYLTINSVIDLENNEYSVRIPNKEVEKEFKDLTAFYLHLETNELSNLYRAIKTSNPNLFLECYKKLLMSPVSYHDLINENSYHMFLLGICLYIKNDYEIISNREEGNGRCDIILKAKTKELLSYVIEFKYINRKEYEKHPNILKSLAIQAIQQIEEHQYDIELTDEIIYIGLAHCGKHVEMFWKQGDNTLPVLV